MQSGFVVSHAIKQFIANGVARLDAGELLIGCAGWSIPASEAHRLPGEESHLERYARSLNAVEIDSSFYRSHRRSTYQRWADSVPDRFRFSVKIPKQISHEAELRKSQRELEAFISESSGLGPKLSCLLLQLPPSLSFDAGIAGAFFTTLSRLTDTPAVCEPRHPSWFTDEVDELLRKYKIVRVLADPDPSDSERGKHSADGDLLAYFRLHGSPKMYYSSYGELFLKQQAERMRFFVASSVGISGTATNAARSAARSGQAQRPERDGDRSIPPSGTVSEKDSKVRRDCWCIFDNTAQGAAIRNALDLMDALQV